MKNALNSALGIIRKKGVTSKEQKAKFWDQVTSWSEEMENHQKTNDKNRLEGIKIWK